MPRLHNPSPRHFKARGLRWLKFLLLAALLAGLCLPVVGGCTPTGPAPAQAPPQPSTVAREVTPTDTASPPEESPGQPAAPGEPSTKQAPAGAEPPFNPVITATVTEVVDGDTFRAVLAGGREEKVRLIGVDTPESTREVEPYGKEAAAYTNKRLSGRTVYLELDVGERDKYGRLLAYVWLSPPESASESEVRSKMYNAGGLIGEIPK